MTGKLFVIDGVDCSGKETQARLLFEYVKTLTDNCAYVSFPNYSNNSSFFIKQYLGGQYGDNPLDVDPYTAATMYALDRYHSYKTDHWGRVYNNGGIVICDRYVSSNVIHQSTKLKDSKAKLRFIKWLYDLEYRRNCVPREDLTIFLDMPVESIRNLIESRNNKITGEQNKDIHEKHLEYISDCRDSALSMCKKKCWRTVKCTDVNGNLKSIDDIHARVISKVIPRLLGPEKLL